MKIAKILEALTEEDCLLLFHDDIPVPAMFDETDKIKFIDGGEHILVRSSTGATPVPTSEFSKAVVMTKFDFVMMQMMECAE